MTIYKRRDILKTLGGVAAGAAFTKPGSAGMVLKESPPNIRANQASAQQTAPPSNPKPPRPLTAVVLGAGNRGNVYAGYAASYPDELKIVGVAEPVPHKNEGFARKYGISPERRWITWEHALDIPKFADLVIITTPDNLHYGPAMKALELGYDLLLEKAIAQSWKECRDILVRTKEKERIVGICHVLRYTPYFRKLRDLCVSGTIGDLLSIQHLEPVEHLHMSHSFVRGPWRNTKESNPMILSKSCHDLDILRWIVDKPSTRIQSFGSLSLFRSERAPAGSTTRCTDGCAVEAECPYSALKIYLKKKIYLGHLNLTAVNDAEILQALKTGPYGRCVYRCDNDVVDHQVTNIEFEGGITAAFSMEGLTSYAGRRTRIMGTKGDIVGDEAVIELGNFKNGTRTTLAVKDFATIDSGHGGGDYGLVRDLIQAVSRRDPSLLTSTIEASMESHLMAFEAEESRHSGKVRDVRMDV